MRVLLSTIGSRGDVQPVVALARELKATGHDALLVVPPNFQEWVESHGLACVTIGPDVRKLAAARTPSTAPPVPPSKAQRRAMAEGSVREQFRVLLDAARGRDVVVACAPLQFAARSVAQALGIRYVFATWTPVTLPSPGHAPPKMRGHHPRWLPPLANRLLWRLDERRWNYLFGGTVNDERGKLGLPRVGNVQRFIFSERPWLACDPVLSPAERARYGDVVQTGAWFLPDDRALAPEIKTFLAAGDAPVFLGFGSMRASPDADRVLIDAARALGRRVVIAQGWAHLAPVDAGDDVIGVGDVNYERLLPRVAAIVHHGGAGTTTAAARAGTPQVIVPHLYDQYYWARRVETLGVGVAGPVRERMTPTTLADVLRRCLAADVAERARALAPRIVVDGAKRAAQLLTPER